MDWTVANTAGEFIKYTKFRRSVSELESTPSSSSSAQSKGEDKQDQPDTVKKISKAEIDKLDGPDIIQGRIYQMEKIAIANTLAATATTHSTKFQDRTETRFQWFMAFGVGTVILGVGGAILKLCYYDISQEDRMRVHVQDAVGNLEKFIMTQLDNLEKATSSKIEHLSERIDTCLDSKQK
ncbi:hypothetical protein HOY80DRAFT_1063846 [Tuber brumale]|nr:hypothetical protein HOY80DRAFT_1063846 [Tuber brumale]